MANPITIPQNSFLIPVNLSSSFKTFTLPVVSTNAGRMIIFKDMFGNAANSTIRLSTFGLDRIERSNISSMVLSNSYGAWTFLNDGITNWFLTDAYLNTLSYIGPPSPGLSLQPSVRYSFLSANYSGSGNVTNVGSNSAIGSATVVTNSYTATSPGFITNIRNAQYVLTASGVTFRTYIIICKVRDATSAYFLDGRTGMGSGYIYVGGYGPDWNGTTYYKDAVLTAFPTDLPTPLSDSLWHHITLVAPATYTTAMTIMNRFSFNEGAGCDIGEVMFFTQTLTLQQVKDNYNFFAARFGLTPVS